MKSLSRIAVALLFLLSACGGSDVTPQFADADESSDGQGGGDSWEDVTTDLGEPDLTGPDLVEPDVPDVADLGQLGDPCDDDLQCASGLCIAAAGLGVCTEGCTDDCPDGWTCMNAPWSGVDVMFACFPDAATLCLPCQAHTDCAVQVDPFVVPDGYAKCMDYGVEGDYCAVGCETDEDCPAGYACTDGLGVDGAEVTGCKRKTGVCDCSDYGIAVGAATACKVGNEYGSCVGQRYCDVDGLTPCEGEEAQPETCNGLDDDCDGSVDEKLDLGECEKENEFGLCVGPVVCEDGEEVCTAAEPAEEACDGVDNNCDGEVDEGYPDDNGNGLPDCLESDVDEDGILDYLDNCVEIPNPEQLNFDEDAQGDVCDADDDNDGVVDDEDCDPLNAMVYPEAEELCNGVDDDCDGEVDEDFLDSNGDGTPDCMEADTDGDAVFDYEDNCIDIVNPAQKDYDEDGAGDACDEDDDNDDVLDDDDCDPLNEWVYPDGEEYCDGLDNDCDGEIDEDFDDLNQNGIADCNEPPDGDLDGVYDDDDNCVFAPNPDQVDTDDDGLGDACDDDDDNDGLLDGSDNCPLVPNEEQLDADMDGAGDACDGDDDNDGVADEEDCEPFDPAIYPGNEEACNQVDDNCDGNVDEGYPDDNGNGIADCAEPQDEDDDGVLDDVDNCVSVPNPDQANSDDDGLGDACDEDDDNDGVVDGEDCEPLNGAIFPGAVEVCNAVDEDCDGEIDEDLGMLTCGAGICANEVEACVGGEEQLCEPLDVATDEACNGQDDDCDGETDEELGTLSCGTGICVNEVPACIDGVEPVCEPLDVAVDETCNGLDDDCDGEMDEELGTVSCGLGECAQTLEACVDGGETVCDPLAGAVAEVCDNLDNDCDGETDEGLTCEQCQQETFGGHVYWFCANPRAWTDARVMCQSVGADLAAANSADEDAFLFDTALAVVDTNVWWFGYSDIAAEGEFTWSNGDAEEYENWYNDEPNDAGAGEDCGSVVAYNKQFGWNDFPCATPEPYICEDLDMDGDGTSNLLDDDMDGDGISNEEDNCPLHVNPEQVDYDGDGLGQPCDDDDDNDGDPDVTDCAPIDPAIYAGAPEVCDEVDSDCDGSLNDVDAEGCTVFYEDADEDGYGSANAECLCLGVFPYTADNADDCDDTNAEVHPGAMEKCGDAVDYDCDPTTNCFWMEIGGEEVMVRPVQGQETPAGFYQYGQPSGSSSNTGYEEADVATLALYEGPGGGLALVIILDAPAGGGGEFDATFSGIGNATVLVSDDNTELHMAGAGVAAGDWAWMNCCNDGGVIGPLDTANGFDIEVTITKMVGITKVQFLDGQGGAITIDDPLTPFTISRMGQP